MPAGNYSTNAETLSALPLARLDGQDEAALTPLRKYLVEWGCRTITNPKPNPREALIQYQIVYGNYHFVKKIFAQSQLGKRILILLWGEGAEDQLKKLQQKEETKIVLVDPVIFDPKQVLMIFTYFFSDEKSPLDLREKNKAEAGTRNNFLSGLIGSSTSTMTEENDRFRINQAIGEIFGKKPTGPTAHRPKKLTGGRKFFLTIFFAIFLLPVWYLINLAAATLLIFYTGRTLGSGDLAAVGRLTRLSRFFLGNANLPLSFFQPLLTIIGFPQALRSPELVLTVATNTVAAQIGTSVLFNSGSQLAQQALMPAIGGNQETSSPAILLAQLKNELFFVETNLGQAAANLKVLLAERPFLLKPKFLFTWALVAQEKLNQAREKVSDINKAISLYPELAGFKQKQTYLLLFQNSLELRPAGGFIGSIGILSLAEGRLLELLVKDVYELDGQLRGHVPPPGPIASLLGQEHWYLRDSNWEPDFRRAAAQAAWFYEKESGESVDGVVAINVPLVVNLLRASGPLLLSDYNDQITAENFFGKSLYYTQANFFPGSTQKKDFLGILVAALLTRLTSGPNQLKPQALWEVFASALRERDVLFYFNNPNSQAMVEAFGWAGAVPGQTICKAGQPADSLCVNDYLLINEANLGVNKANYFVKRQGIWQINLSPQESRTSLSINYQNASSSSGEDGGGNYVVYLRLLTPVGMAASEIRFGGEAVKIYDSGEKLPSILPYAQTRPLGELTEIAIAFNVPAQEERHLAVSYYHPRPLAFQNSKGNYVARLAKQPGANWDSFQILVNHPLYWEVIPWLPPARGVNLEPPRQALLAKEGSLQYNLVFVDDKILGLTFGQ